MDVRITDLAFNPQQETAAFAAGRAEMGAIVSFVGQCRDRHDGHVVEELLLEQYPGFTEKEVRRICGEIAQRFGCIHFGRKSLLTACFNAIFLVMAIWFAADARATPISFSDLLARPRPSPTKVIPYGPAREQHAELWSPAGLGPHKVVIMIHGGCWLGSLPGTELMAYASEDLRRRGIAVWNIEYRRIGGTGGGYPGTFEDVGHVIDHLRAIAPTENLDLGHVVAVGHSAGGHLALWAAARARLPRQDRLFTAHALPIKGVISLAGIADLAAYRAHGPAACGGPGTIDRLVGADGRTGENLYANTSPAALLPLGVRQVIVSGALDPIVPMRFGEAYAAQAKGAGDKVQILNIAAAGHFELIDPTAEAWHQIEPAIEELLR